MILTTDLVSSKMKKLVWKDFSELANQAVKDFECGRVGRIELTRALIAPIVAAVVPKSITQEFVTEEKRWMQVRTGLHGCLACSQRQCLAALWQRRLHALAYLRHTHNFSCPCTKTRAS